MIIWRSAHFLIPVTFAGGLEVIYFIFLDVQFLYRFLSFKIITASKPIRVYNSRFCFAVGLFAGTIYAIQNSNYRFVGLRPNESEIKAYGVISEEDLAEYKERAAVPNIDLIKSIRKAT